MSRGRDGAQEHIRAGDIFQVVLAHRMSADVSAAARSRPTARCASRIPRPTCTSCASATSRSSAPRPRCWCAAPTARSRCGRSPARGRAAARREEDRRLEEELRAEREGARRARHARGPRAQRRRPRERVRHGRDQRVHGGRALLAGHAPGLERARPRARRAGAARRGARLLPGRHGLGRAQGARHGDHRGRSSRVRRGVYAGAVGHFDYHGNLDLAIAIRTLVYADGRALLGRGRGHRRRLGSGGASGRRP